MPLTVPDIHAITARRVHNLPDSWRPRIYEYLDRERKFALTGAVPIGTYSRGPRKGLPKWPPLRDLQRVVITMDEMRQTQIQWEHETGKGGTTDEITLRVIRAAELLQQRHAEPVPVSERLPEPSDCDGQGRCWLFSKVRDEWRLVDVGNPGVPRLRYCFSHWLPATALPLPQQETPND